MKAEPKDALLFCSTHEAYRDSPHGEPLFPDEVTVGAVCIVRNPLDDGASDQGRLERAAANSSFARLRENEVREGFSRLNPRSRTYYFRSGVAGDWRRHLSAAQAREVQAAHGPTMARFGYNC